MWGRGWGVLFRRGNGRSDGEAWEERERTREAMAGMPRSQARGIELGPEGSGADGFQRASLAIGRWRGVHLTGLGTQREGAGALVLRTKPGPLAGYQPRLPVCPGLTSEATSQAGDIEWEVSPRAAACDVVPLSMTADEPLLPQPCCGLGPASCGYPSPPHPTVPGSPANPPRWSRRQLCHPPPPTVSQGPRGLPCK